MWQWLVWVLLFSVITIAVTYPLVRRMSSTLPGNLGDPLLNAWIIGWGAQRLLAGFQGFWQAPIFFPYDNTLAYSEHLLGVMPFVAPVYWATGNAVLAYNIAFIGSYILAASGLFLLARALTGRSDAALLAALVFAFSPCRTGGETVRLQVLAAAAWLPFALLGLHRYLQTSSRRHLAGFAAAYLLGALSSTYFLYFFALPAAFVGMHGLLRVTRHRVRTALELTASAIVMLAAMAPVLYRYEVVHDTLNLHRSIAENVRYSADVSSYVHVWSRSPLARVLPEEPAADRACFQGLTICALAIFAVVAASAARRRRARERGPVPDPGPVGLTRGQIATLYGLTGLSAFVLSLGPEPRASGRLLAAGGPYRLLMALVPGLDGLRAPARFSVVVSLCLAVLGSLGAAMILERRSVRRRVAITLLLCVAVLAEGWAPIRLAAFDPGAIPGRREAAAWLAHSAPGAVLVLPICNESFIKIPVANETPEMTYQYETLWHGHPLVNGTSGYESPLSSFFQGVASPFGRGEDFLLDGVEAVRRLGVRYVVVQIEDYYDQSIGQRVVDRLQRVPGLLTARRQFGLTAVLSLAPSDTRGPSHDDRSGPIAPIVPSAASEQGSTLPLALDGRMDTRWTTAQRQTGSEWVEIAFDRSRDVAGLRLAMGTAVEDYPRRLVVESLAAGRAPVVVFEGSVLPELVEGLVRSRETTAIDLVLSPNRSEGLRLRQTGHSRARRWSIAELALWER